VFCTRSRHCSTVVGNSLSCFVASYEFHMNYLLTFFMLVIVNLLNEKNLCVLKLFFSYLSKFNEYVLVLWILWNVMLCDIFYCFYSVSSFFEQNLEFDYHAFADMLSFLDHTLKSCNVEVLLILCSLTVLVYHL